MPLAGVISAENSQAVFPFRDGKPHCRTYYLRGLRLLATENVTADAGCCRREENQNPRFNLWFGSRFSAAKTPPNLRLLVVFSLMVGMMMSLMVLALRCLGL
jgi:hypothetical protein